MSWGNSTAKASLFSNAAQSTSQPQSNLYGNSNQNQSQQSSNLFALGGQPQQNNNPFNSSTQPQQQQSGFGFGGSAQQQGGGLFGQSQQQQPQQQQQGGVFGQSRQQQPQQPQPQQQQGFGETLQYGGQSRLGQSQPTQTPFWQEGRGQPVYRSVPQQLKTVRDKWNPNDLSSPFRAYLYQNVEKEEDAVKYVPGVEDDAKAWEKAVDKRPGPTYVPVLCKGFFGLGRRGQLHMDWIHKCQQRLHEINNSLEVQLDKHRQSHATRLAECRRRHELISRRTLSLAVKIQILRNKGYVMDNAEEELREKLTKLEKEVFDPTLNAREQEIWARMLEIRERAKRLKQEMERIAPSSNNDEPILDEATQLKAKAALEDYEKQLQYLRKQLELVQQDFEEFENASNFEMNSGFTRR